MKTKKNAVKVWVAPLLQIIDIGTKRKPHRAVVGVEITVFTKADAKRVAKSSNIKLKFEARASTQLPSPLRTKHGRVRTDACAEEAYVQDARAKGRQRSR